MKTRREQSHHRRKRIARLLVIGLFVAFGVAELLLWYFTQHRVNPWPFLRGHVVGSALVTTVLLVGLWRRIFWARYILIVVLWYLIAIFGIVVVTISSGDRFLERKPVAAAVGALALYLGANILIIRSRRIQQLAQPPGSGG